MRYDTAKELLAKIADPATRADLSDYGVNTLRDYAAEQGWDRVDMAAIMVEELGRARRASCTATPACLDDYVRASRIGSPYRLPRRVRVGIFFQLAVRALYCP